MPIFLCTISDTMVYRLPTSKIPPTMLPPKEACKNKDSARIFEMLQIHQLAMSK
jgi:hypothetical protein